jgi:23S rRNA pseudouridine1911/1915/1917 synthase
MRERKIQKTYRAWVEGITAEEGTLKHFLTHGSFRALVDPKGGKEAILHYKRLKVEGETSLVEIQLETGRYHQIRAQFSAIGHPIIGDEKYGAKPVKAGIALCHHEMRFPHPTTKEIITCQLPEASFV